MDNEYVLISNNSGLTLLSTSAKTTKTHEHWTYTEEKKECDNFFVKYCDDMQWNLPSFRASSVFLNVMVEKRLSVGLSLADKRRIGEGATKRGLDQ